MQIQLIKHSEIEEIFCSFLSNLQSYERRCHELNISMNTTTTPLLAGISTTGLLTLAGLSAAGVGIVVSNMLIILTLGCLLHTKQPMDYIVIFICAGDLTLGTVSFLQPDNIQLYFGMYLIISQ